MKIESLKLKNFRNYDLLKLEFDEATNIFYGDNAQGKTNILEAVYLSGTTKSHRGAKDRDLIKFDQNESHIETSNFAVSEPPAGGSFYGYFLQYAEDILI